MLHHRYFNHAPTSGQFAIGGVWEDAWSFPCSALPDDSEVRKYVKNQDEVAFEAFYGDAFFGVRLQGNPEDVEAFALTCLLALRVTKPGESLAVSLAAALGFQGFGEQLAFMEVGAVNAWRSVGALRIEVRPLALPSLDEVWASLLNSPVAKDMQHQKAIEFAYKTPLPHWFGIPISEAQSPCQISPQMLGDALLCASS